VLNELEKDARPKWVRTAVNMDDHIIVPELDHAATSADPDKAPESWIDFPTAEAAADPSALPSLPAPACPATRGPPLRGAESAAAALALVGRGAGRVAPVLARRAGVAHRHTVVDVALLLRDGGVAAGRRAHGAQGQGPRRAPSSSPGAS